ncbi:MAG: DUF2155 domain-containing protein [Alphaproteobacteria bacterium]|nr:DUF2155 domain-containing protein [Alphaproteobacteria bacterium]
MWSVLRKLAVGFLVVIFSAATAQEPVTDQGPAIEPVEELSELDRLSRTSDDPFAGILDTEKREPVSVTLRALNKITARFTDIEIEMHQIAEFGSLELQPRTCDTRPPEEFPETTVFLEIFDKNYGNRESDLKIDLPPVVIEEEIETEEFEVLTVAPTRFGDTVEEDVLVPDLAEDVALGGQPAPEVVDGPQAEGVNIFRGWMFASSPALNALEHPVYDVWVIDCNTRVVSN